ncbi:MAG TPA: rhodanese-like domain-containing protein [Terriglobales bacterium]|nr:rhodanese-like domain-containing protein [Terriglobales bacterium]
MKKFLRYWVLAVASCLLLTAATAAMEPEEGLQNHLAHVHWLEKNLKNPNVVILDASPQTYAKNHIPGAVSVNIYELFAYGFGGISDDKTEQAFQSWGISPGKKIIMYDSGGDNLATRLFFDLDYHGFPEKDLYVLDGGLFKWQKEGLPVTKDSTPAPKRGSFKIGRMNEAVRVGLPDFLTGSGDPVHYALVEGLEPTWHFGAIAPFERGGHPPNGIMAPMQDFYNPDKTFKSPEEIRTMLNYLGIRPEQQLYTYCGGGVAASVPFFAAKFIADYPKVKLFPESELGWLSDSRGLPYWTFDAPYLMRQTGWLQFWSGKMIRMFLGAPVSIVDVRPAAQFNQGHVPFSLNVPAEVFQSNVRNPAKLAEILGPAGVNPTDEAVVVSGAGLTKDSALAFVMLEKLGQKKVSVFMDSMEQWAKLGYPVSKDATVVGPKKAAHDLSIPPSSYPEKFPDGVVIADANSTHGTYPKIFIASGKEMPSKAQDGKIVHVPYAELLNADGTPKAAKDIWQILEKAGVPRYAELVCVSDDPGEASVDYFILKLMGFPDVKVLAG